MDIARLDWRRQVTSLAPDAMPVGRGAMAAAVDEPHAAYSDALELAAAAPPLCRIHALAMNAAKRRSEPRRGLIRAVSASCCGAMTVPWPWPPSPATFCCIELLAEGGDAASAHRAATEVAADFDRQPCLQALLARRLIVAFTNEDNPTGITDFGVHAALISSWLTHGRKPFASRLLRLGVDGRLTPA